MKTALTIAGSDSSGGAGIQADIKTMTANGVYAMSAVTALTAQNTTGVYGISESSPAFLANQLDCIFTDIYPDAVKTGMVSSTALIQVIADKLRRYSAQNIVVDPVMISTSGSRLLSQEAVAALKELLLPLATVLTPNIPEAEVLSGLTISGAADMERSARIISEQYGCAVLCKGGHQISTADDLLWKNGTSTWFRGCRINNPNTHGTGCTLSSAIAANLAKGYELEPSVERAKAYLSGALASMLNLGRGCGPINHLFDLNGIFVN
ncbi:MAG: bifunctional hydroxymethylpyrimidine kinase/phosphomethylpyrimidine kinase [Lawsonibacter sp.]